MLKSIIATPGQELPALQRNGAWQFQWRQTDFGGADLNGDHPTANGELVSPCHVLTALR
jgi:hypothetical protein